MNEDEFRKALKKPSFRFNPKLAFAFVIPIVWLGLLWLEMKKKEGPTWTTTSSASPIVDAGPPLLPKTAALVQSKAWEKWPHEDTSKAKGRSIVHMRSSKSHVSTSASCVDVST